MRSDDLDPSQRAVLDVPVGASAVVLGAPGTGKTRTAVELLAHRVREQGFAPAEVLLLAPRRTQAARLRDRLVVRLGVPVDGPPARTPASLAFDIARRAAIAEERPQPVLLAGGEQDVLIAQLLGESHVAWPDRLGPDVRALTAFRGELRDLYARCVEHDVDPAGLEALGERHGRPAWVAAGRFWSEYYEVLTAVQPDAFDSAELAALAAAAVARGAGGEVADRLRLVVVDDLQDAGESTVALLAALAARGTAIVAFGDPDVAADTFRGGEPDLLGRFESRLGLPSAVRLRLTTVHRHPEALRRFVTTVTARIGTALAGPQRAAAAAASGGSPVTAIEAGSNGELALAIAHRLRRRHLEHDVAFGDQAVVVRSGAQAEPLARALEAAGVPAVTATTGLPVSSDRAASALLDVVATGLGVAPLTPETAVDLLTGPFGGMDRLTLRRLRLALRVEELAGEGTRSAGELLVDALERPGRLVTIEAAFARRAARLAETLEAVRVAAASGASAEELLWLVWDRSGLAATWRERALSGGTGAAEANRDLDGVVALFTAAARAAERAPTDPASVFVLAQRSAEVPDDTLAPRGIRDGVLVTTPVGVAGLEFDTVVLAGLQDGVWPNLKPRGSLLGVGDLVRVLTAGAAPAGPADERRAALSDELRLVALAASRARQELVLAAVANEEEAPSVLLTHADERRTVRPGDAVPNALRPLVGTLRRTLVSGPAADRAEAAAALARLAREGVAGAAPETWHGLAEPSTEAPLEPDPEARVRVSPSKLEQFERSPLDWFVDRVAGGEPLLAGAIGTILHRILEESGDAGEPELLAALEGRWHELDFEADWIGAKERRLAERMVRSIARYLEDRRADGTRLVGGETPFTFAHERAEVRGTIDRVEQDPEGRLRVVDLKTGSTKVPKAEALTHAQLGVYQLAVLEGVVPGAPSGAARSGASLLYVREKTQRGYALVEQPALTEEGAGPQRGNPPTAGEGKGAPPVNGGCVSHLVEC
ncbi:MAG: PD-(D/E)XK nuclease family protein, partial [Amnibacterium sp.]